MYSTKRTRSIFRKETIKIFSIFLTARLLSVFWNNINDCDETYNYWEPGHFLLFNNGFQTWEYSPTYAIRSYAYLWVNMLPAKIFSYFISNKVILFYLTRLYLATLCSASETFLYKSIIRASNVKTANFYCLFSIFSAGLFSSATSFLPSSFAIYITCLTFGCWFNQYYRRFIFFTALGAIVGWPFTAVLSLPMAICLFIGRSFLFIKWALISALTITVPVVLIDSYYFGKLTFASINILLYNVFTSHGPNIYGTEPFSYYFLNLFLNFNFLFLLSLSLPVWLISVKLTNSRMAANRFSFYLTYTSMFLWYVIFFSQPHKEERFMYPVYPLICLTTAFAFYCVDQIIRHILPTLRNKFNLFTLGFILFYTALSLSRIYALYHSYGASLEIYNTFPTIEPKPTSERLICLAKEWYRFPSNFFVPKGFRIEFIESEFRGQLPAHFDSTSLHPTRVIPAHMNDENKEEIFRYVNASRCDYIIDSDYPQSIGRDIPYSKQAKTWSVLNSLPFLDSGHSSRLFRSFYVPFVTERHCSYVDYNLLINRNKVAQY